VPEDSQHYRDIGRWWRATRKDAMAGSAVPTIADLLDRAARDVGLRTALEWDLAGDVFRDRFYIDDGRRSVFDDEALCDAIAAECRARAKLAG
jgi:hypothetical protein